MARIINHEQVRSMWSIVVVHEVGDGFVKLKLWSWSGVVQFDYSRIEPKVFFKEGMQLLSLSAISPVILHCHCYSELDLFPTPQVFVQLSCPMDD